MELLKNADYIIMGKGLTAGTNNVKSIGGYYYLGIGIDNNARGLGKISRVPKSHASATGESSDHELVDSGSGSSTYNAVNDCGTGIRCQTHSTTRTR